MIKQIIAFLMLCGFVPPVCASSLVLVYDGEEQVLNGTSFLGTSIGDGVVISADKYQSSKNGFLAGAVEGPLRGTSLVRLDIQLNAAYLKFGEVLAGSLIQEAHKKRSVALKTFLPETNAIAGLPIASGSLTPGATGTFLLKINGQYLGAEPVLLNKRLKKSKFKLEIVNPSTAPVWNVEVELTSEPKLAFWKEGRKTGLNDVPQKKLQYSQQIFFRPMSEGKSIEIPIEVFFIEEENYVWMFKIASKNLKMEQAVLVKFKS